MNKRILFCATVDYHFKAFHLPYMKWFNEQGWSVDIAASGNINLPYTHQKFNIAINRSPLKRDNITAYQQLKNIIKNNNYDIIHCHTPLGGILTRLAAKSARKLGTIVIYTAHGFHFYKGAPLLNWLLYYPVEKYMSKRTDCLITINREDYYIAKKHQFRANNLMHIPGVGIDIEKFKPLLKNEKQRKKLSAGFKADDFLLFNAGEFNHNKNQSFLIHSMVHIVKAIPNAKLLLAGEGKLLNKCQALINQFNLNNYVQLLGFRKDIDQLLQICDISVASSFREGLPVNVMEAMSSELPVVAVSNRGHKELVNDQVNGYIIDDWDEIQFANKVRKLVNEPLKEKLGQNGRKMIVNEYSVNKVLQEKMTLYKNYMEGSGDMEWVAP